MLYFFIETRVLVMAQIEQVKWTCIACEPWAYAHACMQWYANIYIYMYIFPVFQIKFEHFSFGLTVKRNQNASKRRGHSGCPQGPPRPRSKPSHPPYGPRRSRTTYSTAEPQRPHVVTHKVKPGLVMVGVGLVGGGTRSARAPRTWLRWTLRGAVAPHDSRRMARGRVMNSYLKLQFSGFECSHVVETHFLPFSSRSPCQVWHTKCLLLLTGTWKLSQAHKIAYTQALRCTQDISNLQSLWLLIWI